MISPTWRTVVALVLAACSALWWSPFVMLGSIAAVVVAFLVDGWRTPAPVVDVHLPRELVRGAPVPFAVTVTAATRVQTRQPQTAEIRFDPSTAEGSLVGTVIALVRGVHELQPPVTRTLGLLGLSWRVRRHGEPFPVTCHADLPGARRIATAVRQGRFDDPGERLGPLGLGTDFETIRDYTPDDDIRRMNWLASERTGRPMVNQYREDTEREVWFLLDSGRLLAAPVGERTRFDLALDAAAAVGAVADVMGDRVGAVVFDERVRRTVRPRRSGTEGLMRSLEHLRPVMSDSDYWGAFHEVASAKRALVMVFTDILDGAAAAPLLDAIPVLVRRHAVIVAGVVDPDLVAASTGPVDNRRDHDRSVVAADLLAERDQVRAELARLGAVVVDVADDALPSACVAGYLRLKSRARL